MHPFHRRISACLLAASAALMSPVFAQDPAGGLNGKTIHLYVESDDFTAFYFQEGDIPLKADGKYRYSLTLSGLDADREDFFLTSNGNFPTNERSKWKLGKNGLNTTAEVRFLLADFQGKDEMWIVVDPAGPIMAPPVILLQAPRTVNILNPWNTTAPKLISGAGKTRRMSVTPGRCGWFTTLLFDPTITVGHFAEINATETYGKGGFGSQENYDFTALFAVNGNTLWLNTQANAWTAAYPNIDGVCQYLINATVRDFSRDHPDFDFGALPGDHQIKGMVNPALNLPSRKPVRSANPATPPVTFDAFDSWWATDSTNPTPALRSYESCIDIPMGKSSDGRWGYDSYRDSPLDHSFFPIEGAESNKHGDVPPSTCYVMPPPDTSAWVTGGPKRNGNFCMESHATFIYQPGQTLSFRGDDDVWMFIDNKLVMDLGGVHVPKSDSINMDALGLTPGKEYNWDFFYCDRQPCGSALQMKTSIFLKQQRALYGVEIPAGSPGAISLEIWKHSDGSGSCSSIGNDSVPVKATSLVYQVVNSGGTMVKDLGNGGVFHGGAIKITTPVVTVDTSLKTANWETLAPGSTYRVVAFEPANPALKVELPFRVPASATGLSKRRASVSGPGTAIRKTNVLGRRVRSFPDRVNSPVVERRKGARK